MKNVKKLVAIGCTIALSIGIISGCSQARSTSAGSSSSSTESKNSKPVNVDIFQFKVEAKDALIKATKKYMSEHNNVTINVETVGGGSDYSAALKAKFASGQEPAIFNIGGTQDVLDWKDKLEDLSSQPWVKQAYQGTLDSVTDSGKIYGLPFDYEGYGIIYNKAIFQKAGIDASKIKNLADLQTAAATLDAKKKDLGLNSVIALPGKETWVLGMHMANVAFGNEFKSVVDAFNAKTIDFKYADGLKNILDFQMKYAYKPDNTNKSINSVDYSTQVEKEFSTGKVAMIQQGNWIYGTVKGIDPDLAKNMGLLPLTIDGVSDGKIPVGVPEYWSVNSKKDAATKAAAEDFLNWLYTSDEGKTMIIHDFNFIPAFKGYDGDNLKPDDPISADILKYANSNQTMPWVFNGMPTGFAMNQLGADMQKYISGDLTWDKVVQNAKNNWASARK